MAAHTAPESFIHGALVIAGEDGGTDLRRRIRRELESLDLTPVIYPTAYDAQLALGRETGGFCVSVVNAACLSPSLSPSFNISALPSPVIAIARHSRVEAVKATAPAGTQVIERGFVRGALADTAKKAIGERRVLPDFLRGLTCFPDSLNIFFDGLPLCGLSEQQVFVLEALIKLQKTGLDLSMQAFQSATKTLYQIFNNGLLVQVTAELESSLPNLTQGRYALERNVSMKKVLGGGAMPRLENCRLIKTPPGP
ncbi:MAG: hypothetical protein H6865_02370 [Rhodospirillales bacterium]|nr:hypothetical protein [Alphaproteobacteria bacterium]MCB9986460.1 hypothetical protein [Rhodospirillales bacterium]USO06994.1 MAG: hypothetical protein H6866_06015 [Rhodospirillales bacterium]